MRGSVLGRHKEINRVTLRFSGLAIAATAVLAICNVVYAQNLVINGDFEAGSVQPAYWELSDPTETNASVFYPGPGTSVQGNSHFSIQPKTVFTAHWLGYQQVVSANMELRPNSEYEFSYYWRPNDVGFLPYITGTIFETWGGTIQTPFWRVDAPFSVDDPVGEWTRRSVTIYSPPLGNYSSRSYLLDVDAAPHPGGNMPALDKTIDFDDVQLNFVFERTTSTVYVSNFPPIPRYNYNIDLAITWHSFSGEGLHKAEIFDHKPESFSKPALAKYWSLDPFAGTFSATPEFSYTDSELVASGLDENDLALYRRQVGGPWQYVPFTADATINSLSTAEPVSGFSDWLIGQAPPTRVENWTKY